MALCSAALEKCFSQNCRKGVDGENKTPKALTLAIHISDVLYAINFS